MPKQSRASYRMVAAPTYLAVLARQVMMATAFGPTAWTACPQQQGTAPLHRGGSQSSWSSREHPRGCPAGGDHVADITGKQKRRVRMMSAVDAGAAGGGGMRGGARGGEGREGNNKDSPMAAGGAGPAETQPDYYAVLGLAPGASSKEVKDAYRKIAMRVHPDTEGGGGSGNRDAFEMVTAAYEVLSDPGRRSTYDQGLAMRSFVDKVKAGKWANVMSAVASLGAAATSVGVSAGVAAAEPLAKDLARGLEELTGSVDVDPITRQQQAVNREILEAERKKKAFERRAKEFSTEASKLEEARVARLQEQKQWNTTLDERREELVLVETRLEDAKSLAAEANEVTSERRAEEQATTEAARRSKVAREEFMQASTTTKRRVSMAEATVETAEQRLREALKAFDVARDGLKAASEEAAEVEAKREQVIGGFEAAEKAMLEAREAAASSRTLLSQRRESSSALQGTLREKSRSVELAVTKLRELGDTAESLKTRAQRNLKSAEESKVAALREAEAIAAAERKASRLATEAVAAKAKRDALEAAAQKERAQRDKEAAAREAEKAVARALRAEAAAGAAADAAIRAADAARDATAEAVKAAGGGGEVSGSKRDVGGGGGGAVLTGGEDTELWVGEPVASKPWTSDTSAAVATVRPGGASQPRKSRSNSGESRRKGRGKGRGAKATALRDAAAPAGSGGFDGVDGGDAPVQSTPVEAASGVGEQGTSQQGEGVFARWQAMTLSAESVEPPAGREKSATGEVRA